MNYDFFANEINVDLLNILLYDRTTHKNIIWATHDYEHFGERYGASQEITRDLLDIIQLFYCYL